ncbi:unnamed protein product [Rhizophagus irregularis]|nr:unnamed protein product [Rhizophagus irregularis]
MSHQDISAGGRGLGHDRSYANVTDILDEDADLFDSEEIGKPVSQGYDRVPSDDSGKTGNIVNDRGYANEADILDEDADLFDLLDYEC